MDVRTYFLPSTNSASTTVAGCHLAKLQQFMTDDRCRVSPCKITTVYDGCKSLMTSLKSSRGLSSVGSSLKSSRGLSSVGYLRRLLSAKTHTRG